MIPYKRAACLCALRDVGELVGEDVEILLVRRAFWNQEKDTMMSYPGEWVIPGGMYDNEDGTLVRTAMREFREETGYDKWIRKLKPYYSVISEKRDERVDIDFYLAKVDPDYQFSVGATSEVIDIAWKKPEKWLKYIVSMDFNYKQKVGFRAHSLERRKREFPLRTLELLEKLASDPLMLERYFRQGGR